MNMENNSEDFSLTNEQLELMLRKHIKPEHIASGCDELGLENSCSAATRAFFSRVAALGRAGDPSVQVELLCVDAE
jgi:hypothetical protein